MKNRSHKKGFSFTEVMIATVIMGIVAASLATVIPSQLVSGREVQEISKVSDLAQRYMETIKSDLSYKSTYDALTAGSTPPVNITSDFTDNGAYTVQTKVTNLETEVIDSVSVTVLREIDIEYKRTGGTLPLISISTLVARPE